MTRCILLCGLAVAFYLALVPFESATGASFGGPGGRRAQDLPRELEPLREQSWTWQHGLLGQISYEVPFAK